MLGFFLAFLAGLMLAMVWTKSFVTERFGLRYWGPLLIAIILFLWGRAVLAWDLGVPHISQNSWEVTGAVALLGFVAYWVGVPLLSGLAKGVKSISSPLAKIGVVVLLIIGFLYLYEDPRTHALTENVFVLAVVLIGGWFALKKIGKKLF